MREWWKCCHICLQNVFNSITWLASNHTENWFWKWYFKIIVTLMVTQLLNQFINSKHKKMFTLIRHVEMVKNCFFYFVFVISFFPLLCTLTSRFCVVLHYHFSSFVWYHFHSIFAHHFYLQWQEIAKNHINL